MSTNRFRLMILVAIAMLLPVVVHAQFLPNGQLSIESQLVTENHPWLEIYTTWNCHFPDGDSVYWHREHYPLLFGHIPEHIRQLVDLRVNGTPIKDYLFWRFPGWGAPGSDGVLLAQSNDSFYLIDGSAAASTLIAALQDSAFLALMDELYDIAVSYLSKTQNCGFIGNFLRTQGIEFQQFNDSLHILQPMHIDTSAFVAGDTSIVIEPLSALVAQGKRLLWDGLYNAVVRADSVDRDNFVFDRKMSDPYPWYWDRPVLGSNLFVFTNGFDEGSTHTPDEIIHQALKRHVRVIVIDYGPDQHEPELERIARKTRGLSYRATNTSEMTSAFLDARDHICRFYDELYLLFDWCESRDTNVVTLTYTTQRCGTSNVESFTYVVDVDTAATFMPMEYVLPAVTVREGKTVTLPLELITGITTKTRFYPSTVRLLFDTSCIKFAGIPGDTLLCGAPVTATPIPGGIELHITEQYVLASAGVLGYLRFTAGHPYDTTACTVRMESWVYEAGCHLPVLREGEVTVFPNLPAITGFTDITPSVVCTPDTNFYDPNPITARFMVVNRGEREALNPVFRIVYNPADLELSKPQSDTQPGNPRTVYVERWCEAQWKLRALPRVTGDSVEITAIVSFDNHPDVTITGKVYIPPTCPKLECNLTAVRREASSVIDVTVSDTNLGGETTDSTYATVVLPAPLTLFGPDAPDKFTKVLTPEMIAHSTTSAAAWQIDCSLAENKDYTIGVWSWSENADSVYCEATVTVELPVAACSITAPDKLTVDDISYTPNPFDLDYTLVNTGNAQLDVTQVTIQLPGYITTTDPLTQSVSALAPSAQHDITWPLTALTSAYDRDALITVTAKDSEGNTLSVCEHTVFIPGVDALSCEAGEQIVLTFDLGTNGYLPDPINRLVNVNNGLDSTLTNVEIEASVSSSDVVITMPNPPMDAISQVPPGQNWTTNWVFEVVNLLDKQTTVTATFRTRSDQYPDWHECSVDITIPPRQYTYCADCTADGIDTVWSNLTNEVMLPVPFQVYTEVANNCTGDLSNIQCTITLPAELSLAPGVNRVQTIKHIAPDDTMYVFWDVMASPNENDYDAQVQIAVTSSELTAPSLCNHTVRIVHTDDIQLNPAKKLMYFMAVQDGNLPAAQSVMVYAGFPTEMPWTANYNTWLDVSPSSSSTSESVSIQPNTTSLPYGRYWGKVDFASAQPNAPKFVEVVYDVVDVTVVGSLTASANGLTLHANYPNPFSHSTTINYTTQSPQPVTITVYNTLGVPVRIIQHDAQPGENTVQLTGLKPGIYMLVLQGKYGVAMRMIISR